MATSLRWRPLPLGPPLTRLPSRPILTRRVVVTPRAFRRDDFDRLTRDAWRRVNNGFEELVFEAKKTAERIDRKYDVTRRVSAAAQSASARARDLDRELKLTPQLRAFSSDFYRNWPRYRKTITDFLDTPLGRSLSTVFLLWFALSGWLFRSIILAVWVLPLAGPLLIGTLAKNLIIRGNCPSCRRQFIGNKNQIVRCAGCGNTVWQPKGDFYSGSSSRDTKSKRSDPEIIDVDFEEK